MKEDARTARKKQITQAAYVVLQRKGYAGTSMLAVAKQAKASNETLYNWYGDKTGLFAALIEDNAQRAYHLLLEIRNSDGDIRNQLIEFSAVLLEEILSDRVIGLNRAAASDPTGQLGRAIAEVGRNRFLPVLIDILKMQVPLGAFKSYEDVADTFLRLLIGDQQIRRVVGGASAPMPNERRQLAELAVRKLWVLLEHFD